MLNTTKQALTAILSADPSVTIEQRKAFLESALQPLNAAARISRVIRREEAGKLLGVSPKRIDQLARAGILKRIQVPGQAAPSASARRVSDRSRRGWRNEDQNNPRCPLPPPA